jgi:cation diffusion facilitator CzcD-associated flavoprotein CzcO
MGMEQLDVLIVGAGLSGIDAAYWMSKGKAHRRWAIFEARDAIGGTWDLFRYPGLRSDSDMATLGFPFRPWTADRSIAAGADIRDYIRDTAAEYGINQGVRLNHRVTAADWSSADAVWTVTYEAAGDVRQVACQFLFLCSGYYDYAAGHAPTWPGMATFAGQIVHPQFWPDTLAIADRRIVVIGSGATAVTLVPALTEMGAAHVTMVQRSPTYIVSRPSRDTQARTMRRWLPVRAAGAAIRWKNILYGSFVYTMARRKPHVLKQKIAQHQRAMLGPDFDIDTHLTPRYDPWDQRLCLVPDGDLFKVLRTGQASIVTDNVVAFEPGGLRLASGGAVEADMIVTATGLKVQLMGGARITVDGAVVDPGRRLLYKGAMLDGVPNLAFAIGYTNASWTLKCDLTSQFVRRLLDHMEARVATSVMPQAPAASTDEPPILDLTSGYVQRAAALLPRQGARAPWRVKQNYVQDLWALWTGRMDDGVLHFGYARPTPTGVAA